METETKQLTYTQLRDHLKELLEIQNIPYIHNVRKELNALNLFAMDGVSPDYVVELISKLIEIKRHKQYATDPFWVGCVINISDAYSYRVKIENLHFQLYPPKNNKPTQSADSTKKELDIVEEWRVFLLYCKQKLTNKTFEKILNLKWDFVNNKIIIETKDDFVTKIIQKHFWETHKIEVTTDENRQG